MWNLRIKRVDCFYLLEEIVENCYNFFLKCLIEITSDPSGPGASCFGRLLIIDSISLIDKDPFRLLLVWILADCIF